MDAALLNLQTIKTRHYHFGIDIEYVPAWELRKLAPQVLPLHWRVADRRDDGIAYVYTPPFNKPMSVIMSCCREDDGKLWLHVSASKRSIDGTRQELPSWEDMATVKALFVGRDRKAIQVFPVEAEHVNLAEILHLWACLDGDGLPDFTHGTGSI
jgi:hypothetical protein